jgi:ParB/RepB/Spo0J family partition protein
VGAEEAGVSRENAQVARVAVERLRAHPRNIRSDLGDLRDLAESIRHEGVLVPLMAERRGDHLRLLHGHRRWAAAQIAGLNRVPVVIVDAHEDDEATLLMLAEDKKEAVTAADKGRAVLDLVENHGYTFKGVAARLGFSEATVRNWAREVYRARPVVRSASKRGDGRPRPPRINPGAVHDVLVRFESGDLDPDELIAEMRGWLGEWQPVSYNQAVSPSVVDLVEQEDYPGKPAHTVAARLGISTRHVVRARSVLRERDSA